MKVWAERMDEGYLTTDFRDVTISINFSIGGFFDGYKELTIERNDNGAIVSRNRTLEMVTKIEGKLPSRNRGAGEDFFGKEQINGSEWENILDTLYNKIHINGWEKKYDDNNILDGTQWHLIIGLTDDRRVSYYGSNQYPPHWNKLLMLFRRYMEI